MTSILVGVAFVALSAGVAPANGSQEKSVERPPHQVVAIYFHRTVRCPTCKRVGALAEEAVVRQFEKEVEAKSIVFLFTDFQDKKNAEFAKGYKISGPTLVLVNVFDGKVVRWIAMPKVWPLVGQPAELQAYVQAGVSEYLRQSREEAESKE
jgi:hypothetical protein